jgi:hypothetical protein
MKINGVEFETEVEWDCDGMIDSIAVFLPGSDVELSEVLDEKVLTKIEEELYKQGPDQPEDYREDR